MRYYLNLAAFHIARRDIVQALTALRAALSEANRDRAPQRASIMRAMNYARAIAAHAARAS